MVDRAVHIGITGHVQGVGFRAWVAGEAAARGLGGWVRNRRDGSVEAVFWGADEMVTGMLGACRHGPQPAEVAEVTVEPSGERPVPPFRVLPTA